MVLKNHEFNLVSTVPMAQDEIHECLEGTEIEAWSSSNIDKFGLQAAEWTK